MADKVKKILVCIIENRKYGFEYRRNGEIRQCKPSGKLFDEHRSVEDFYDWLHKRALSITSDMKIDLAVVTDVELSTEIPDWNYTQKSEWTLSDLKQTLSKCVNDSFCLCYENKKHLIQNGNIRNSDNVKNLYVKFSSDISGNIDLEPKDVENQSGFVERYYRQKLKNIRGGMNTFTFHKN